LLVESVRAVPWETDPTDRVTYIGPQVVAMLEHSVESWHAPGFWEAIIHPEDRQRILETCRRRRLTEDFYELEYRMLSKSGRVVWVLDIVTVERSEGRPVRLRGSFIDITARKEDEIRTRENEERFRQLTENCHQAIWLQDLDSQQLLYVNPSFERILGHNRESICSDPLAWTRIVYPEDLERAQGMIANAREGREGDVECRIVKPDGAVRWVRSRSVPVRDSAGRVYRQMGMAEDITEVRALEAQLMQAQKMEAIGTMAGGIAHDFNNILGAILGFAELAKMDSADPQLHSYLGEILKASHRAKELVRQILAFSRKEEQNRTAVDLKNVVAEAAKLLRATTPSTIDVRMTIDPDTPPVLADATQLQQVLMNLAVNGVQAMERGPGVLEIGLQPVDLQNESIARQLELAPGAYAQLTVCDTGCGIPTENLSRIFDPFFTTKPPGAGTGLGLSVVHGIVRSHGGAISVDSEPARGSLFRIYIPLARGAVESAEAEADDIAHGRGERILFVDDEAPIVRIMSRVLSSAGYRAEGFTNAEEAARVFSRDPDRFDLVISDLTMPGCDGVELGTMVRTLRPQTPMILVSGFVPAQEAERIGKLGANAVLAKPIERTLLLRKIGQVLASAQSASRAESSSSSRCASR
jgi:PAS domain S-box-containing protein